MSYKSKFIISKEREQELRNFGILKPEESARDMVERLINTLFLVEKKFGTSDQEIERLSEEFGWLLDNHYCVMSTPIINNAGRYINRPLSACTVPPLNLNGDWKKIQHDINRFHIDGMGTGFNFNDSVDPVKLLKKLNDLAIAGANSGQEDRPVGNMAVLSVHHPKILDFINSKTNVDYTSEQWKFNISLDISEEFIIALKDDVDYKLWDGRKINAKRILNLAAQAAHKCGDPGLIFLQRLNVDNTTPFIAQYTSVAPCGEIGLSPGESCQFGYINLGKLVLPNNRIDLIRLENLTRLMIRVLDNALEISIKNIFNRANQDIMRSKRKIGLGVCGLADMLIKMKLPYDSELARKTTKDVLALINYISKDESIRLAKVRGSFAAMSSNECAYNKIPSFISRKFSKISTEYVSQKMWEDMDQRIRSEKMLRHCSTTALPPTGRSSLVIEASAGIEPLFSVFTGGKLHPDLQVYLKSIGLYNKRILSEIKKDRIIGKIKSLSKKIKEIYKTALEINPKGHLLMVSEIQKVIDESVSKTINLPSYYSIEGVYDIFFEAIRLNLKGVTIYRDGSRYLQPNKVAKI